MKTVTVVGSGASAVHFAQTALDNGWRVQMLDVGRPRPEPEMPEASFLNVIDQHDDAARYFLGDAYEATKMPGRAGEYHGFRPHRGYIFDGVAQFRLRAEGFDPLQSFAQGGLAEAWTGGVFPFTEAELEDFPFGRTELAPCYDRVADRIGIMGLDDDIAPHMPVHSHLAQPVDLDPHSAQLLGAYEQKRADFHRAGVFIGRSRGAILRDDRPDVGRLSCTRLGRCQWGCPRESLYTPALTLRQLLSHEHFEYRPGLVVTHFEMSERGRINHVVAVPEGGGNKQRFEVQRLVLAAGTLSSCKIYLDSIFKHGGEQWTLEGLMDNRQVSMPFINLAMIGQPYRPDSYQYHQLVMGLVGSPLKHYVHCQITTLKTAMIHPIVQRMPLDLRAGLDVFRHLHAALGVVDISFHDTRRPRNQVTIEHNPEGGTRLVVGYTPADEEPETLQKGRRRVRSALWKLGCVVLPWMEQTRPMGSGAHYAGALPMSSAVGPKTTSATCRSHDFENLWFVDGTTFPFLPAKSLTFTLMANATRVAQLDFD